MNASRSDRSVVSWTLLTISVALVASCGRGPGHAASLPSWSFDRAMVFPIDSSLAAPEDGIALPDGRLIVTDQVHGLRLVAMDGTTTPFGDLAGAGYVHRPPDHNGGANGISLEPDGRHLLLTEGNYGGIYRVDVVSGATELVYHHRYGVNTAVRDSRGAIWFTQSTANADEARMWAAVDVPIPDGALLWLAVQDGHLAETAEVVVDSLLFANGVAIDEQAGQLYVAETTGNRVLRFRVDLDSGRLSERTVFADIAADNVELDGEGHLWVVAPLGNEVVVINTKTGERHTAFHVQTPGQQATVAEFLRRGAARVPRMDLIAPDLWAPLPGMITGVIVGPGHSPVYITGLGNALIRLVR
jgi:sugar lactone lactonase YvrE